jgi:hypothetical protein
MSQTCEAVSEYAGETEQKLGSSGCTGGCGVLLGARLDHVEHLLVARCQIRRVARRFNRVGAVESVGGKFLVQFHEVTLHALTQALHVTAKRRELECEWDEGA